jgi:hypothetical protein
MATRNSLSSEVSALPARPRGRVQALRQSVMNCKPAVQPADMNRLADMVFDKELTVRPWRLTAAQASKDGSFYRKIAADPDSARAIVAVIGPLEDFAKRLRSVADLADIGASRLLVACAHHEKFKDWVDALPAAGEAQ